MSLATPSDLATIWACPRCRAALSRDAAGLRCPAPDCEHGRPRRFLEVGGQPVLVDFGDSVLDPEVVTSSGATALVERRSGRGPLTT